MKKIMKMKMMKKKKTKLILKKNYLVLRTEDFNSSWISFKIRLIIITFTKEKEKKDKKKISK